MVRPARENHAFKELVWILVNYLPVFEGARLRFIGVAYEIDRLGVRMADEAPFNTTWKASAASTAEASRLHLLAHLRLGCQNVIGGIFLRHAL